MKIIPFFVLTFLVIHSYVYCVDYSKSVMADVNRLLSDRQYQSAFEMLKGVDPNNENPDYTIKKVEIATKYFVKSINHIMFSFVDLGQNDNLDEMRASEGAYSLNSLNVEGILTNLIRQYPNHGGLYNSLGCYYYSVFNQYGDRWMISSGDLLKLCRKYLLQAEKMGKIDDVSLFDVGMTYFYDKDKKNAMRYFKKSLENNGTNADSAYNIGYIYYQDGDYKNSVKYALLSSKYYKDPYLKSDAFRVAANAYIRMNDDKNALDYYDKAISVNPKDYYSYGSKITVYLKQKDYEKAALSCEEAIGRLYDYPELFSMINEDYLQYKKSDDLESIYDKMIVKFSESIEASGNLYFYQGILYAKTGKKEEAKKSFIKSRSFFEKKYKPDHQVFEVIKKWLASLE